MSHGYINPKKIAELGQTLLEEAILAVLAEAHVKARESHKRYLAKEEISKRAGIYMPPNWRSQNGIVDMLAAKLESEGKIINGKWEQRPYGTTSYGYDRWKLADPLSNT